MQELLKISYEAENPTVSARELHDQLNIGTKFTTWFQRMTEYGFSENTDYKTCYPNLGSENHGGQNMVDYQISVDMAKEICMIQRSPEGKRIRQYFIDLEKAWNTPEQIFARALKMADKTIEELKHNNVLLLEDNVRMKPKEVFADAVSTSQSTICDGFACSAASVVFMAGDERIINEASLLMIHNAWTYANGNATELRKAAEDLDKITQASVNAYVSRATISEDEIKNLMDNETWITAQEAVEYGFATKTEKSDDGGIKQSAFANIRRAILKKPENVKPVEIAMQLDDEAIAEVIAERVVNLFQKKKVPSEPKEPANSSTGWSAFFE